jgi:hypothetical protein
VKGLSLSDVLMLTMLTFDAISSVSFYPQITIFILWQKKEISRFGAL